MSLLEIIHLRYNGEAPKVLGKRIKDSVEPGEEAAIVVMYQRQGLDTDVAIHIHHEDFDFDDGPSATGLHLASALRAYGLVRHSLWDEIK